MKVPLLLLLGLLLLKQSYCLEFVVEGKLQVSPHKRYSFLCKTVVTFDIVNFEPTITSNTK